MGVNGSGGDPVGFSRDRDVSVTGSIDAFTRVDGVVIYGLGRPRGEIAEQWPENTPGRFVVREVWSLHVVCAFQCSDVGLPELGLALDGFVSANHVQVLFEKHV